MTKVLALITAISAIAACDTSTDGAYGNVAFTPEDCGRVPCNFDDSIGVGGILNMKIAGLEGVSTVGVTIESDDPNVLSAVAIADTGGKPTWELQGLSAGVGRLTVYTQGDEVLDFLEVGVQEISGLIAENILGNAVGPSDDASFDEVWTINADEAVSFQITPSIGSSSPLMGRYLYTATIDQGIEEGLIEKDLGKGYLYFSVPAGDYQASFEDDYGHTINMLLQAQ